MLIHGVGRAVAGTQIYVTISCVCEYHHTLVPYSLGVIFLNLERFDC